MEKQLYIVENVLPREKRARKSLVCRWVVIASSPEEAIELAVEASVREVLDEPIDAEDLIEEKKCGEWQATAEGQVSRLPNRFTWR
jgi:hypothetical protein